MWGVDFFFIVIVFLGFSCEFFIKEVMGFFVFVFLFERFFFLCLVMLFIQKYLFFDKYKKKFKFYGKVVMKDMRSLVEFFLRRKRYGF